MNDEEACHEAGHMPKKMTLTLDGESVSARFGNFSCRPKEPQGPPESDSSQHAAENRSRTARQGRVAAGELIKVFQACNARGIAEELQHSSMDVAPDAQDELDAATLQREHVYFHREPHTNAIWRKLLEPLVPSHLRIEGLSDIPQIPQNDFGLRFEHIADDRIPLMSYISLAEPQERGDPLAMADDSANAQADHRQTQNAALAIAAGLNPVRRISPGDWMRLAFVDDEGDSSKYPYSPAFFSGDPLGGFAYDRFWHPTGTGEAQDRFHSIRWLCSGYALTVVGNARDCAFFADEQSGALCHFRHHYFAPHTDRPFPSSVAVALQASAV